MLPREKLDAPLTESVRGLESRQPGASVIVSFGSYPKLKWFESRHWLTLIA